MHGHVEATIVGRAGFRVAFVGVLRCEAFFNLCFERLVVRG